MARIVPAAQLVSVVRDRLLGQAASSARLARIARETIAEVEQRQGLFPRETMVDGRKGVPEDSVSPTGRIVYLIHPFANFFDDLVAEVLRASPIGPEEGKSRPGYRGMHYVDVWKLIVDGIPEPLATKRQPRAGETWVLVNTMPYAKKIGHGWSAQAPALWIDGIARKYQRQYGKLFGAGRGQKGFSYSFLVPPAELLPPGSKRYGDGRLPAIVMKVPGNAPTA